MTTSDLFLTVQPRLPYRGFSLAAALVASVCVAHLETQGILLAMLARNRKKRDASEEV